MSLTVEGLKIKNNGIELVSEVHFICKKGERIALVGESGSGKSLTALSVLKLLPENFEVEGKVEVNGKNVLELEGKDLRSFRWKEVSIVFQDPSSSLNPLLTVGEQIKEALSYHGLEPSEEKVLNLLRIAEVPEPEERIKAYPHHLSGGLKQRVAIAMALACSPDFLIADEPTTALDVTVQRRILGLFKRLSSEENLGVVLITHDMGVVKEFSQKTYVIYSGSTVESGPTEDLFSSPLHPYTKGLIECSLSEAKGKQKLPAIPGNVPEPSNRPKGCPFHPRCKFAKNRCREELPPLKRFGGREVRCFFPLA
jgi:oligopeptide/dipeptide ABC transporter ATP-binding protein